ncbi:MAG TPA: hypothetical protein VII92_00740, partial [Anaerolineae bacterium]
MRFWIRCVMVMSCALILSACGSRPLLSKASFAPNTISPNGDGVADATQIHYELSRKATLSIYLESSDGQRHYFRKDEPRASGTYDVLFGGAVDGRLLPDGPYKWIVEAVEGNGPGQSLDGQLFLSGGESTAPQIANFTVLPKEFTPNQDGISDRTRINVYLNKPASLYVTLQNILCNGSTTPPRDQPTLNCAAYPMTEKEGSLRKAGEAGLHQFDYDAGVDQGAEPPADGEYVITARVEDQVGQVTVATNTLTIAGGGVPRAEIVDGTVVFSAKPLLVGQTLYFTLTVENYGSVPIRTSGPVPGYVYTDTANYNVPGFAEESGAWRVAIDFDTSLRNYPFRWAVGGP